MKEKIQNAIADDARRLDEIFFQLGDVLDVKASIILVVITFLGALSGQVLVLKDLPLTIKLMQVIAVLLLTASLSVTICSLWPREFDAPPKPEEWLDYLEQLTKHFEDEQTDSSDLILEEFEKAKARRTLERIAKNRGITNTKSDFNTWAFRGMLIAAGVQSLTLLWLAFWHL